MQKMKRQNGMMMVMMAVIVAVLFGIAGLALDVGRLYVLHTEMQNAVDAAALAGAAELNGEDDAITRSNDAIRNLLQHSSHFATVKALLGDVGEIPASALSIVYYCSIGSRFEPDEDEMGAGYEQYCSVGTGEEITEAGEAHYVRVTLNPAVSEAVENYSMNLLFLPALRAIGLDVVDRVATRVTAVAGRHFFMCNYPPMAICDPFEGMGSSFKAEMNIGDHIILNQQGAMSWDSGNFGFLEPYAEDPEGGGGASALAYYLASDGQPGCDDTVVVTETGGMENKTAWAINTRFDQYSGPPFSKPGGALIWPPAPNIQNYFACDKTTKAIDSYGRFGSGDWDSKTYMETNHPGVTPLPSNASCMYLDTVSGQWVRNDPETATVRRVTRYEVYSWELGELAGCTNSHMPADSVPVNPAGEPERRVLYIAVMSCVANDVHGKTSVPMWGNDGFAKVFVTRMASDNKPSDDTGYSFSEFSDCPGVADDGDVDSALKYSIYGEYMGWVKESDANYHVDIQLYE